MYVQSYIQASHTREHMDVTGPCIWGMTQTWLLFGETSFFKYLSTNMPSTLNLVFVVCMVLYMHGCGEPTPLARIEVICSAGSELVDNKGMHAASYLNEGLHVASHPCHHLPLMLRSRLEGALG